MNKENIAKVIEAIKVDGKHRFNMSTFIGKITNPFFKRETDLVYSQPTNYVYLKDLTADLFNCDSVGCIAGFATAVSNGWKNPFVGISQDQDGNHISTYFEEAANKFLGLNKSEGTNLYYGDGSSVWKFLLYMEDHRFPELQLEDEEGFEDFCWDSDQVSINLRSITPEYAITLLQMLIDDEISLFGQDHEPEYLMLKENEQVLVDEDLYEQIMSRFAITDKEG